MSQSDTLTADRDARDAAYQAWTAWSPLQILALALVVTLASAAAGAAVAMLAMGDGQGTGARAADGVVIAGLATSQAVMIAGALWIARARDGSGMPLLALGRPAQGAKAYVVALAVMIGLLVAVNSVLGGVFGHDLTTDLKTFSSLIRGPWGMLVVLIVGIGAPLSEELLFRGVVQGGLWRSMLGYWGAAAVGTVLWTALHAGYSAIGLAEVFMIGMLFALFLRSTGSLRVPIFCHAAYNLTLAFGVRYLPPQVLGF